MPLLIPFVSRWLARSEPDAMLIEYQPLLSGSELDSTTTTREWLPSSSRRGPYFLMVLVAVGLVYDTLK